MAHEPLAKKFIEELGPQELWPPLYNSSIFVQASGWNSRQYYTKYYQDNTPFPLLLIVDSNEGVMHLPITQSLIKSKEIFRSYWHNTTILKLRLSQFKKLAKRIDDIYFNLSYDYVNKEKISKLLPIIKELITLFGNLSALAFFTLNLDDNICRDVLEETGDGNLLKIWTECTVANFHSFEKRREYFYFDTSLKEAKHEATIEKCQYLFANYNKVYNLRESEEAFDTQYGTNRQKMKKLVASIKKEELDRDKKFNKWYRGLSFKERKLANFIQNSLYLRDVRKDYFSKMITSCYRVAERMFSQVGISHDLILFYGVDELARGQRELQKSANLIRNRKNGYCTLVHYDGRREESSNAAENKKFINNYYNKQQKQFGHCSTKVINGQTGFQGKIRGFVRVIKNLNKQSNQFQAKEILVTGMTRPEFIFLINKASAIVTDEGGVTCHAAVVSRELRKPCIIGTKIATQVLRDGDYVEVDANRGTVKIIKRK
ncbi:MAG TPA: PEP-utilizing enzyme [bacterium]|nr:PEP-utilizing enzyme [bacterium]